MPDFDALFAAYEMEVAGTSYDLHRGYMDAIFKMTMRDERFDEPLHDRLVDAHDGIEDDMWRIEALDTDHDETWATCVLRVEARTLEACRLLQPRVVAALPTFQ